MFPGQSSPFAAKVRFFEREEIRNLLGDLLSKYYRAANKDVKDEEDCENEVHTMVESYGDTNGTVNVFTAIFCEHPEFATIAAAESFLNQAKGESDPVILDTLVGWADAVVEDCLGGKPALLVENSTTDGLLHALQPFSYQLDNDETEGMIAPWPLVSAIDFGLDHPLLDQGIVFVDSPGLSDTNSFRTKNAILSHRECTHKIIVAEIGRAEAGGAVRKNLLLASRTRGSSNLLLVLTHGDSIDPQTEVFGTPLEEKLVKRLETEFAELTKQTKAKQQEMRRVGLDDRVVRADFREEIRSLGLSMRKRTAGIDSCRLEMRNRKVLVKMQAMYKGLSLDPKQLTAFAVGNQAYQQHVAGFSEDDSPHMSVKK